MAKRSRMSRPFFAFHAFLCNDYWQSEQAKGPSTLGRRALILSGSTINPLIAKGFSYMLYRFKHVYP